MGKNCQNFPRGMVEPATGPSFCHLWWPLSKADSCTWLKRIQKKLESYLKKKTYQAFRFICFFGTLYIAKQAIPKLPFCLVAKRKRCCFVRCYFISKDGLFSSSYSSTLYGHVHHLWTGPLSSWFLPYALIHPTGYATHGRFDQCTFPPPETRRSARATRDRHLFFTSVENYDVQILCRAPDVNSNNVEDVILLRTVDVNVRRGLGEKKKSHTSVFAPSYAFWSIRVSIPASIVVPLTTSLVGVKEANIEIITHNRFAEEEDLELIGGSGYEDYDV